MPTNNKHTDFDIDFNKNTFTNDLSLRHDRQSIRQSIMNIVLTRKGEKPFNRSFGIGMHSLLFESPTVNDLNRLEMDIKEEVSAREPRATVVEVLVNDEQDGRQDDTNKLTVEIQYNINQGSQADPILDSLKIALTKVR